MPSVLTSCILMRASRQEEDEFSTASRHFPVYRLRSEIPAGSLVVGRYANLPFHRELEQDVANLGSRLINSTGQHSYIADFSYYEDLRDLTFPTWFRLEDVPRRLHSEPLVVKGRTNSRKFEWQHKMFAQDFPAAVRIATELANDGLIGQQGLVVRQFVPLQVFQESLTGPPMTNEWRIFYLGTRRLAHGYYWGNIDDWAPVEAARADFERHGLAVADEAARRVSEWANFFVVDVARTADGRWVVVELNDGCQAGLNGVVDADELYGNLKAHLPKFLKNNLA